MRLLAPVMAFVVLVAGCASKSDPPAPKEQQQVDRLRALPFDDGALGVVTQVLGGAGVAIFDDAAADGTGPVRLTRWQVRNLAVEAANGGGVRGDALGELAVAPAGAPPLAYLIAAMAGRMPAAVPITTELRTWAAISTAKMITETMVLATTTGTP